MSEKTKRATRDASGVAGFLFLLCAIFSAGYERYLQSLIFLALLGLMYWLGHRDSEAAD